MGLIDKTLNTNLLTPAPSAERATPSRGSVGSLPSPPTDRVSIGGAALAPNAADEDASSASAAAPPPPATNLGLSTSAAQPGASASSSGTNSPTTISVDLSTGVPISNSEKGARADRLRERLHVIESVSRSVSGDYKMGLEAGDAWAYDLATNTLYYKAEDMEGKSEDYALGVILQETGRRVYSRQPSASEFENNPALDFLHNAVEGPRVCNLQISKFAGAKPLFQTVYQDDLLEKTEAALRQDEIESISRTLAELYKAEGMPDDQANAKATEETQAALLQMNSRLPRHVQFALGMIHDWCTDGKADAPTWLHDKDAVRALSMCQSDYRDAMMLQRDVFENDLSPKEIAEQAKRAEGIVVDKLWPVFKQLVDLDEKELGQQLFGNQSQQSNQGQQSGQGQSGEGDAGVPDPKKTDTTGGGAIDDGKQTEEQKQRIRDIMKEIDKAHDRKVKRREQRDRDDAANGAASGQSPVDQAGQDAGSRSSTGQIDLPTLQQLLEQKAAFEKQVENLKTPYEKYYTQLAPLTDEMAGQLKNILHKNADMKYAGPFRSGRKLDMRSAMQSAAKYARTGQYDDNIWLRREDPSKRDYDFVFVLDESGSMQDSNRWDNLLKGAIMSAEALEQLKIGFSVIGFSDQPAVHKRFEDTYDETFREKMLAQIQGADHGGTNDSDALAVAIDMLGQRSSDNQKIIVIITDGEGKEAELREQIAQAQRAGVKVIGVGIGDGTSYVNQIYPEAVTVSRINDLPYALTDLIREKIVEGFDEGP